MILQERDLKLIRLLIRFGVLSTRQIRELVFHEIAHTTVMRRLRLLEGGHYVRRGVTLADGSNTWSVGRRGIEAAGFGHLYHFTNRNGIEHDVRLTDVRIALERLGIAKDFTPEFEMRASRMRNFGRDRQPTLIPDGIIIESIAGESCPIALELELTRKSHRRYQKILDEYAGKHLHRIWYVVNHWSTANAIMSVARSRICQTLADKLWFSKVDELLANGRTARIYSCNANKMFMLSEIAFDVFKKASPAQSPAQGVSTLEQEKSASENKATSSDCNGNLKPTKSSGGTASAPDPTPPTMSTCGGLGSGATAVEEVKKGGDDELKKCG
jgi:hypothetical protein